MAVWDWNTYFLFFTALIITFPFLKKFNSLDTDRENIHLILAMIPGFLILSLRDYTVGSDIIRYNNHIIYYQFQENKVSWSILDEPFMGTVEWFSAKLGGLRFFIFFTSFIEYLFWFISLKKLKSLKFDIVVFYYLYYGFIIIRSFSMISMGISLLASLCAYTFLFSKSKHSTLGYFAFSLIACCFHTAALINIVIYFCCSVSQYEEKTTLTLSKFMRLISVILLIIFCYLLSLGKFNSFIYTFFSGNYNINISNVTIGIGNTIIRLPILLLFVISKQELKKISNIKYDIVFNFIVLDIIVAQLKYMYQDFERLTMFTGTGNLLAIVFLYEIYKERKHGVVKFSTPFLIGVYITYYLYYWSIKANYGIMPYSFWRNI